jgi:putative sterol carrier protein
MPRFLSPEWVDAFNGTLEGLDISDSSQTADTATLQARERFSIEQRVSAAPDSKPDQPIRAVLSVEQGSVSLALVGTDDPEPRRPDVVISLSYADAAALSRGELDPTAALGSGKVHVRGDLAVLIAGQSILVAAAAKLADLGAVTTYEA